MFILILAFSLTDSTDTLTQKEFDFKILEYIEKRRSPWGAVMLSFLIPSAGHIYSENTGTGLVFLSIEIVEGIYAWKLLTDDSIENNGLGWTIESILMITRIFEFASAYGYTQNYNNKLKKQLGLEPEIGYYDNKLILSLSYKF